jgi:hypothetical protein
MSAIPADLQTFLNEHRDSREYRRALAVKLALQGYLYATICEMLDVTPIPDGTYIWQIDKNTRTIVYLLPSDLNC